MKMILAHLKKDIRMQRALFLTWAISTAILCLTFLDRIPFLSYLVKGPVQVVIVVTLLVAIGIVGFVAFCSSFLLVMAVGQADPLQNAKTNADAFWRTRPLSRQALLMEKLLLIGLLLAGGGLAAAGVFCHVKNLSTPAMLINYATFAMIIFAGTTITANTAEFFGIFVLLIGLGAQILSNVFLKIGHMIAGHSGANIFSGMEMPHILPQPFQSGSLGICGFYLIATLLVIVFQYLTLKTNTSRGLLFAVFLVGAILQNK
ncbi:MAG: hypothetical protein ABI615_08585 [Chthoniobacterales bacterium]